LDSKSRTKVAAPGTVPHRTHALASQDDSSV